MKIFTEVTFFRFLYSSRLLVLEILSLEITPNCGCCYRKILWSGTPFFNHVIRLFAQGGPPINSKQTESRHKSEL